MISQCESSMRKIEYIGLCDVFVHLKDNYKKISDVVEQSKLLRQQAIDNIDIELKKFDQEFLERDIIHARVRNTVEYNRTSRGLFIDDETKKILVSRIGKLVDWRYPGLEIGPGDGAWTRKLVACDPLYLVDVHQEFLDSTAAQFNPQYQKRLRPYLIKNNDLSCLPQNQFGLVFAWNVFNHMPLKETQQYLESIYSVLRPGGTVLFSYNNSELLVGAAEQAEAIVTCHIPKKLLLPTIEKIGYLTTGEFDCDPYVSWLELTKPGELKTSKAHQVLGEIRESEK